MRKYFLILVIVFAVSSCKKNDAPAEEGFRLLFESIQPVNDSKLSKIPNKFLGLYMDVDSNYIDIKENIILKEYYYKFKFHKNMKDSLKHEFDFVDNQYIHKINNDIYDYKYLGDSIEFSNKQIDTFFIFSNEQKAKRMDGQLVLNYKDSVYWNVKSIRLEKNKLRITHYYTSEDLKRIDSVTKIKSVAIDTSVFVSKPSRNEFKRILNLKNLGYQKYYQKVIK